MLIDWFTVGAQAINFLVLVWLLKRFLYRPILNAIDAREKRVAEQLAEATAKKAQAEKEREDFLARNAAFDHERAALLAKAEEAARADGKKLLEDSRRTAEALSAQRYRALEEETRNLKDLIRDRTRDEVFAIARKALQDLAGDSLERRAAEAFLRQLQNMGAAERADLKAAIEKSDGPLIVRSAFELPPDQCAAIKLALEKEFSATGDIRFQIAPELVAGVELSAGGHKASWSISGYLASMEEDLARLLSEKARAHSENA
jgi:F-type H+-transporting ATPase subunit b